MARTSRTAENPSRQDETSDRIPTIAFRDCRDEDRPFFVPWQLDDTPLSAFEFRLYFHCCRLAYKTGLAWASQAAMAEHLKVDARTVRTGLAQLVTFGMLRRGRRADDRRKQIFELTPMREWNFETPEPEEKPEPEQQPEPTPPPPPESEIPDPQIRYSDEYRIHRSGIQLPLEEEEQPKKKNIKRALPSDADRKLAEDWHKANSARFPTLVKSTPEQYAKAIAKLRTMPDPEGKPLGERLEAIMRFAFHDKFWADVSVSLERWIAKGKEHAKYLSIYAAWNKDRKSRKRRLLEDLDRAGSGTMWF